jgi:hypothetical protein
MLSGSVVDCSTALFNKRNQPPNVDAGSRKGCSISFSANRRGVSYFR